MTSPTTERRRGLLGSIGFKAPVTVLADSNITQSGQQTIDGKALLAVNADGVPDRVLCTGMTDSTKNGIWDVSTAAWTRSLDANNNYDFKKGTTVVITDGNTYAGTYWNVTALAPITLGTTLMTWARALASSISTLYFLAAGAGAVLRGAQDKMRETVSIADFAGATDTIKLAAAFAAVSAGGTIVLPPGAYSIGNVNFTGKAVTLLGYGATVTCTSATGAIYKTDHDNKLSVRGISFDGAGRAINHQSAVEATVYDELEVTDCTFSMNGVYGIYCVGTREPRINFCTFKDANGGDGIYFKDCVSPFLFQCIFKGTSYTRRAVYYPGTGNATDCGLVLRDCEVLGWDIGVEIVGCDWFCIEGCTIDYCNNSLKIAGQDGGILSGNYIGSRAANPALWLTYDVTAGTPTYCDKITVANNTFTGHYSGGNTYDNVLIDGAVSSDSLKFIGNVFSFFTRYGINFTMLNTRLEVLGNSFNQRLGFGVSPIHSSLGASDSGVGISNNYFANGATIAAMNLSAVCQTIDGNTGLILAASAQTAIGVGLNTVTVAHGITGYVPVGADVFISPSNSPAAVAQPYLSAIDAANVTINTVNLVATAPAGIAWRIARRKN